MRNNDEAYILATYMRDMLRNEPDVDDVSCQIEHTSGRDEKMIRVTMVIPYVEN